jgi:hypothetical protein
MQGTCWKTIWSSATTSSPQSFLIIFICVSRIKQNINNYHLNYERRAGKKVERLLSGKETTLSPLLKRQRMVHDCHWSSTPPNWAARPTPSLRCWSTIPQMDSKICASNCLLLWRCEGLTPPHLLSNMKPFSSSMAKKRQCCYYQQRWLAGSEV